MDWSEVEPVLKATYRLLAEEDHISGDAVIEALGRPPNDEATGRALETLERAGYIKGQFVMQTPVPILIRSTEKGLQHASGWPTQGGGSAAEQVDLLVRLLDERIESDETPEEEKGKLRQIRDGVGSASRDIVVSVLAAYVARMTGGGESG